MEIEDNMDSNVKIISSDEGETLAIAGGNYRIVISGDQTNGNYAVIEMTVPPGGGPPPPLPSRNSGNVPRSGRRSGI